MDSLPLKYKFRHNKLINYQLINYYADQRGIYSTLIEPYLDSIGVKKIKGNYRDSLLTFQFNNKPHTVDISKFKDEDGVLFFTPEKKPILWQSERNLGKCLTDREFTKCYFTK